MPNPKCHACGLVNFASAQTCKRCETPLFEESATEPPLVGNVESVRPRSQPSAPKPGADYGRILLKPVTIKL